MDDSRLRFRLQGRPLWVICNILPPKAIAAIGDSLINGAIVGVIFYSLDKRPRMVSPGLHFRQINLTHELGKVVFSLADNIDVAAECDRINVLLGADIMQIGKDGRTISCHMANLYKLEKY
jgi:hypothetical protein